MQGQEIDRNRIGMHVQNREFNNTGFLPIWVFDSQQLEDHRMQKSMARLSQTTRKMYGYNAIMLPSLSLVLDEQEYEKEEKWKLEFL